MPVHPLTNITMPVFGRHDETLIAIDSVRRRTHCAFILTVVDNGNSGDLSRDLGRLADEKRIDKLFILDRNYGVSCASNVGWRLVDAPFFMKLDNDYEILSDTWLENIYGMWGKARYSTLMGPVYGGNNERGLVRTEFGSMWVLPVSFIGSAFLVSKKIRDSLGYFSEDYGLYGEEDADYCLRCHHAGIRKYSFAAEPLMKNHGATPARGNYAETKAISHTHNIGTRPGQGILALNFFLYESGLRNLNVPLKYVVKKVNGRHVNIEENPEYAPYWEKLMQCLEIFNAAGRNPTRDDVVAMRSILG